MAIDNGISGSIGLIEENGSKAEYIKTPTKKEDIETKNGNTVTRIDWFALEKILSNKEIKMCFMERPLKNPALFNASASALRAFEVTLATIERVATENIEVIDSKQWQHKLLPGVKGKENLKSASLELGKKLFPDINFEKFKDADGILIAEWARRYKI